METNLRTNLVKSKDDSRDRFYSPQFNVSKKVVNLQEWASPVEDQGNLGSCVGNAIANAYEIMIKHQRPEKYTDLSRLFIYYNARAYSQMLYEDSGTSIRDGLRGMKEFGACREELWPYDITKFEVRPPTECYTEATQRRINDYKQVDKVKDMMEVLGLSYPVLIGINVYPSFMLLNRADAVVKMPDVDEVPSGAHAICVLGYDLNKRQFLAKNSFGTDWGEQGYCWFSFEYIQYETFEKWFFTIAE